MGRMSFTQELKALARQTGEGMDAGGCWREVIFLHRELGRHENAWPRGLDGAVGPARRSSVVQCRSVRLRLSLL